MTINQDLAKAAKDLDDYESPEFKRLIFDNPDSVKLLFVEQADNKVIGIAGLTRTSFLSGSLFITIRPEFQGKGIGNRLMKSLLSEAREKGYKYITLTTDKEHSVPIHLFEKYGFKALGESVKEWDYHMVLYLSWLGRILFWPYILSPHAPRWVILLLKSIMFTVVRAKMKMVASSRRSSTKKPERS